MDDEGVRLSRRAVVSAAGTGALAALAG
ncbi:MAG: hypothetical protein J07HB67_02683, partial [halophilic archaeon J07HB67]